MTIVFKEKGESFGTRQLGANIRTELEAVLNQGEQIVVDFEGVNVMANSFADECFGKLLFKFDKGRVFSLISFVNANDFVKSVIINSFRQREEQGIA